jgi:integrase
LSRASVIGSEIRAGMFDPTRHFDIKPRFGAASLPEASLSVRMRSWIEEKRVRKVRPSRLTDYTKHLRNYFERAPLGLRDPYRLTREDLAAFQLWLVSQAGKSGTGISEKTASNVIRSTLAAFLRDIDAGDAFVALGRLRWERYEPSREQDPFTATDRERILGWFHGKRPFAEWVSMRLRFEGITPSEVRGLNVGDLDRGTGTIRIQRSRSENLKHVAATKTKRRIRSVRLAPDLVADVGELCGIRDPREPLVHVYESSFTKTFKRAQIALGIRFRSVYQAKHTYATLTLIGGESPSVVANHLGIGLGTLDKHYAAALQKGRISSRLDHDLDQTAENPRKDNGGGGN